ncbi:BLUF domain-containing protein [Sphingomonas sp.]
MLQLVYVSTARDGCDAASVEQILRVSRRNNLRDAITGLLYADGMRFLQVLEGPIDSVTAAYERIHKDPRHRAVVRLSNREVSEREFGEWEMAHRTPGVSDDIFMPRLAILLRDAAPNVRATFESFAQVRRAA